MMIEVYQDTADRRRCRSCDAALTFYQVVESGRRMPFDGAPVFVSTRTDERGRKIATIDTEKSKSHFATCPDADRYRRRRR